MFVTKIHAVVWQLMKGYKLLYLFLFFFKFILNFRLINFLFQVMEETKTEIDQIKQSLQMLDSADEARETYKKLQIELFWAIVRT